MFNEDDDKPSDVNSTVNSGDGFVRRVDDVVVNERVLMSHGFVWDRQTLTVNLDPNDVVCECQKNFNESRLSGKDIPLLSQNVLMCQKLHLTTGVCFVANILSCR